MRKKIFSLILATVMLLGIFNFAACGQSLDDYKASKKAELQDYANAKGQENYGTDEWTAVCSAVENGKAAIEAAESKPRVDAAFKIAKAAINKVQREDEPTVFVEIEAADMIELHTWYFTSGLANNGIKVTHPDSTAIFECSVDNGQLWDYELQQNKKQATLKPNDTVYWHAWEANTSDLIEHAFVVIIVKVDTNIIGYAVIEVLQNTRPLDHIAIVLKSVHFPKIDGEYQNVSEDYINTAIEKVKNQ